MELHDGFIDTFGILFEILVGIIRKLDSDELGEVMFLDIFVFVFQLGFSTFDLRFDTSNFT